MCSISSILSTIVPRKNNPSGFHCFAVSANAATLAVLRAGVADDAVVTGAAGAVAAVAAVVTVLNRADNALVGRA